MYSELGDKVKVDGEDATVVSIDIPRRKYTPVTEKDNNKVVVEVPIKNENKRRKFFRNIKGF